MGLRWRAGTGLLQVFWKSDLLQRGVAGHPSSRRHRPVKPELGSTHGMVRPELVLVVGKTQGPFLG